jgi:2-C-methyl-D-erythritol 4-phosphate cytidylyltransferase
MNYEVIIPAAGQGKRMGAGKNKLLIELKEIPIIIHTLKIFEEDENCSGIYIAASEHDIPLIERLLKVYSITKVKKIVRGGQERQHSVYEALKVCSHQQIILVHDGARPFVRKDLIHEIVNLTEEKGAVIVAVPVKETIKQVSNSIVQRTIDRSTLWSVQTPQAFQPSLLLKAHETAFNEGFIGTDDASLVERLGEKVYIVEGNYDNIKITTPEDIPHAEAIIDKILK